RSRPRHDHRNGKRSAESHADLVGMAKSAARTVFTLGIRSLPVYRGRWSNSLVGEINMKRFFRASPVLMLAFCSLTTNGIAAAITNPNAIAVDDEEDIKQLVVMIEARVAGAPVIGAGIICGAGSDSLYIATANHVVRIGDV